MSFNNSKTGSSTIVVRTVCAAAFLTFTFCWLFFFQSDLLSVIQHVLSEGHTHYNRTTGAVIITAVLWLVAEIVFVLIRIPLSCIALAYFPSFLLLALLCDVTIDQDSHLSFVSAWWKYIVVAGVWIVSVGIARQFRSLGDDSFKSLVSRKAWGNFLALAVMMTGVVAFSNTNAVLHYRAHLEMSLLTHDSDEAMRVGRHSLEADESLTMLRAFVLSQQSLLGERLFRYPVIGTSADLLPLSGSRSKTLIFPQDSIFRLLGAIPVGQLTTERYLQMIDRSGKIRPCTADYILCGLLIDRQLDVFAQRIGDFYELNDSLPRHYREALVLYTHLRGQPRVVYHDSVIDTDYEDYLQLKSKFADFREQKLKVFEKYEGSYWFYYDYCR